MKGMVHLYCGDGKGKTTAAVGLAVRAAGAGVKVLFTQFFKNGSSSEIAMLNDMPNITVLHCRTVEGFFRNMSDEEKRRAAEDYSAFFSSLMRMTESGTYGLLVLDEAVSACNHRVIDEKLLLEFLKYRPDELELVLTGRSPSQALIDAADYVTEMRKLKHPFDRGITARKGIEF